MSLWSPTHIQVTIHSARGVLIKGKSGTNNCFVTIGLGKEKFQTSVQKNATANVEWREECELRIPDRGNRAELVLTCLHKGAVVDDFLGQVTLPLNTMDVYERPRQRWYRLESKPGQEKKDKQRGELEVRIAFTVNPETGSTADLSKKGSRLGLGGSLLSLGDGDKRNKMKNFAKSLGSRMHISGKPKRDKDGGAYADGDSMSGSVLSVNSSRSVQQQPHQPTAHQQQQPKSGQLGGAAQYGASLSASAKRPNVDPGVHSDDEDDVDDDDFRFDNMSHKSSGSSLNVVRSNQHLAGAGQIGNGLPPPSPLSMHSSAGVQPPLQRAEDDVKLRSQTLPPPSKPPRVTPEPPVAAASSGPAAPKVDEWEAKLYGKHLDIGSSADSLKRRSWESSRVIPISVTPPAPAAGRSDGNTTEHGLSSTAPTTPNLEDQKRAEHIEKPRPLPRSATLESIEERDRSEEKQTGAAAAAASVVASGGVAAGAEKTEKRFLHKLKYFQRKDRAESAEDLKMAGKQHGHGQQTQHGAGGFNERIIIGHENDLVRRGADAAKVSQALLKKYEGKTREDMLVLANDLENEVKSQKLKMKEMEDYLDDLLLRVMETHPKILQNPYRNQMSAKSG